MTGPTGVVAASTGESERLSAGALGWLGRHLDHFDPYSARAAASPHGKAKAVLELALLCHCWSRLDTADDPRLDTATGFLRTLWRRPDFARLVTADPRCATEYALVHAALAPAGTGAEARRSALALAAADGLTGDGLTGDGRSPLARLELRYYAEKAGVRHRIEPYPELIARNVLVTLPAAARTVPDGEPPVGIPEAYALTHSAFYLADFGRTGAPLPAEARADALDLVGRLLAHCVRRDWWDLAAELLMAQRCLGLDPLRTPEGAAAIACLARAQRPDGALPGRSPATSAAPEDPVGERFAKAYHTTLVTALMTLLLGAGSGA
ncbi:hypothetical protein [Kitasatospora sp. NPDC093806]|uniref:DUF6895 family protein n=1 Tax=Kitasatospora sp. NPDC093806 TaxID=3155075 RepID=UPI00342FC210